MYLTKKIRLYPNKAQIHAIERNFGIYRFVYNAILEKRHALWLQHLPRKKAAKDFLKELRDDPRNAFLADAAEGVVDQALHDVFTACRVSEIDKSDKPPYLSRKGSRQKFSVSSSDWTKASFLQGHHFALNGIGRVRVRRSFDHLLRPKVLVERDCSGRYYASYVYKVDPIPAWPAPGPSVGIDMGLKALCTMDDGTQVEHPKYEGKLDLRIRKLQREMTRKREGSKRREKARRRFAKVKRKARDQRRNFLHQLSTMLARENQAVCVEDLDINEMAKTRGGRMAANIDDASWGTLIQMLEYKEALRGGWVAKVPKYYPSSQLCSSCGYRNPKVKDLSVRKWKCPKCGAEHDRDVNAAKNILNEGLRILGEGI